MIYDFPEAFTINFMPLLFSFYVPSLRVGPIISYDYSGSLKGYDLTFLKGG